MLRRWGKGGCGKQGGRRVSSSTITHTCWRVSMLTGRERGVWEGGGGGGYHYPHLADGWVLMWGEEGVGRGGGWASWAGGPGGAVPEGSGCVDGSCGHPRSLLKQQACFLLWEVVTAFLPCFWSLPAHPMPASCCPLPAPLQPTPSPLPLLTKPTPPPPPPALSLPRPFPSSCSPSQPLMPSSRPFPSSPLQCPPPAAT